MGISGVMRNNGRRGNLMERVVCIPVEQYILMLQTYDELTEQVREMREILESLGSRTEPDRGQEDKNV